MKVGNSTTPFTVYLPVEVVYCIVRQFQEERISDCWQHDLWACSLVSKLWYATSIASLYEKPQLQNRNFDKFCRTICPPVNSHIRRIGLEKFVKFLNMGGLAYESSNSLTARLLRRTGSSLEEFIAPSVSFSVACLAPLSKCQNLQILDLSRHFHDLNLQQLLDAIGKLERLQYLSLPKPSFPRQYNLKRGLDGQSPWPAHLYSLQINERPPWEGSSWAQVIDSWPSSLESLALINCVDYTDLWHLSARGIRDDQILSLDVGPPQWDDTFPVVGIAVAFRQLKRLKIPASALRRNDQAGFNHPTSELSLERLVFASEDQNGQTTKLINLSVLASYVRAFPRLYYVEIPRSSLGYDSISNSEDLTDINTFLVERAKCENITKRTGVHIVLD